MIAKRAAGGRSWDEGWEIVAHLRKPFTNLASSFSSDGASISKRVRMQAMLRNRVRAAKGLPGHTLLDVCRME